MSRRVCLVLVCLSCFSAVLCGQTAKQIELLKKYADQGSAACCYRLAEYAKAGKLSKNAKTNQAEYNRYFNKALDAGYPKAKLEQAVSFLNGRIIRNQQMAYSILDGLLTVPISRDFSQKDLFEAYYWVGYCLENGKGCSVDTASAYFYYRLASINNTRARIALLWRMGNEKDKNIPLDYLYKIYLDDKSTETLNNVRSFLVHFNLISSFSAYLERKANAGDAAACKILAENEWNGDLFPLNYSRALKHYELAASMGDAQAALKLAEIYSKTDLSNKKKGVKLNRYATFYNIPLNLSKAEYYAKVALHKKETRNDAALLLIQFTKEKLAKYPEPPIGAFEAETPVIHKSGPPLPPVPGQPIAAGRLNKMAPNPAAVYRQLRNELFYYLMIAEDYTAARNVLKEDGDGAFYAKNIYLKAKEFRKAHVILTAAARAQYHSRIRMAANAGYPLAIYEYYLTPEFAAGRTMNYSKLIEAALQMPFPELSEWHWNIGFWFLKDGSDRNPAQGLACIRKAAEMGNPDALEFLMNLYENGNKTLKIAANKPEAQKYRKLLLKHDIRMTKEKVFTDYLKGLASMTKRTPEDFLLIFRALGHSPLAELHYANLYFKGDKDWKISKNPEHGLNMLHFAVRGNVKNLALDELEKHYPDILEKSSVNRMLHYEQKMLPLYRKLR
ncbi:MAG: sel1 repeat family protein [Lentisphaeria bacterium]|nr:sel1 repeat family protein [Lentisphaeria bacterium]